MAETEIPKEVVEIIEDHTTDRVLDSGEVPSFYDTPVDETLRDQADKEVTEPIITEDTRESDGIQEGREESETNMEESPKSENDEFEDIEEVYEREVEDGGEVKLVTQSRIIRVKKSDNTPKEQRSHFEEEYFEEVDGDEGKIMIAKKRLVKVQRRVLSERAVGSFTEKEEEIEEEEIDESGVPRVVKRTIIVRIPKGEAEQESKQLPESYEEVEEEYEVEEENESGEKVKVKMTRMVKLPEIKLEEIEESSEKSKDEFSNRLSIEEESEESSDKSDGADEELKEGETEEEKAQKKSNKSMVEDGEEPVEKEKKKRRRRKQKKNKAEMEKSVEATDEVERKLSGGEERRKSEGEKRTSKDEKEKSTEDVREEVTQDEETGKTSFSVDERAEIAKHYETLIRIRMERATITKKSLFLNNFLTQHFKQQKMDHVFTEGKDDPDTEQRYIKKLMLFYETNKEMNEEKQMMDAELERKKLVNKDLEAKVKAGWQELVDLKKEQASKLIDARTGRTVQPGKTLENLLARQESQWKETADCKLSQIKLKRKIDAMKKERKMDHMGMDNLMEYEKLSSLKEYYTNKITERNKEIAELNKKMATMDDEQTKLQDQLKKKEDQIERERIKLEKISVELKEKRTNLAKLQAKKHATEKSTAVMKEQSGLLAYPMLLKDYEHKKQQISEVTAQIIQLKQSSKDAEFWIQKLRNLIKKRTKGNFALASSSLGGTS